MALSQEEYIAALGDLSSLGVGGLADMRGSPDILNSFVGGGGRFGSQSYGAFGDYRPTAVGDPTYRSGFDYARSIAGGMPMSQVIAPGVSYSPDRPEGYTQRQLDGTTAPTVIQPPVTPPPVRDDQIFVPPVTPPVTQVPDDVGFLGTGIGGVTIPVDRQQVPAQLPQIDLSGIDFSQIQIPEEVRTGLQGLLGIPQIDPESLKADILGQVPTFDPTGLQEQIGLLQQQVPSRDDFMSIQQDIAELSAREIPQFDPTGLQQQIAGLQENIGQITPFDPSTLQQRLGILEQQVPTRDDFMSIQQDINQLQTRPQFDPAGLQQQIGSLEQQIGSIPQFDPSGIQQQISGLQQQIGGIPQFDPTTLQQQIAANQ